MWGAALDLPFSQRQRKRVQVAMLSALIFVLVERQKPTLG